MVIHYPPARLRRNSDQPTAITDVLVATSGSSYGTGEIPLGTTTRSARSRQGIWALYPNGDQVVVVWPGGTVAGPPAEVAGELDRLGGRPPWHCCIWRSLNRRPPPEDRNAISDAQD